MAKEATNIPEIKLPKLFRRGRKGYYYFRKLINGKDTWVCTWKTDPDLAKKEAKTLIAGKVDIHLQVQKKKKVTVHRLANAFAKEALKEDKNNKDRLKIDDLYKNFVKITPGYSNIADKTKDFNESILERFVYGCKKMAFMANDENKDKHKDLLDKDKDWDESKIDEDEEIRNKINEIEIFADEVDQDMAKGYAAKLWERGSTAKTYNEHLKFLSRVFLSTDPRSLSECRNPFDSKIVKREKVNRLDVISHSPLEPNQLKDVIDKSAEYGEDFRDLFIIAAQTGMRLKDAVKLKWSSIKRDGFIEAVLFKTEKSGNTARTPISKTLKEVLLRRRKSMTNEYVLPTLAQHYDDNDHYVVKKCKDIFDEALGEENTKLKRERGIRCASVYSFHSFRSTMMSLLAQRDVSTRDAMRILGWESPEMIRIYEHELEKARGQADERTKKLFDEISELQFKVPEVVHKPKELRPETQVLERLVGKYSNLTIARIYGISNVAVKKWMDKFCIVRDKRIESADVSDKEIVRIRKSLQVEHE